jgi:hypothetical protein
VKIGVNTDSLGELSLDAMLDVAAEPSLDADEVATGAWSRGAARRARAAA